MYAVRPLKVRCHGLQYDDSTNDRWASENDTKLGDAVERLLTAEMLQ